MQKLIDMINKFSGGNCNENKAKKTFTLKKNLLKQIIYFEIILANVSAMLLAILLVKILAII